MHPAEGAYHAVLSGHISIRRDESPQQAEQLSVPGQAELLLPQVHRGAVYLSVGGGGLVQQPTRGVGAVADRCGRHRTALRCSGAGGQRVERPAPGLYVGAASGAGADPAAGGAEHGHHHPARSLPGHFPLVHRTQGIGAGIEGFLPEEPPPPARRGVGAHFSAGCPQGICRTPGTLYLCGDFRHGSTAGHSADRPAHGGTAALQTAHYTEHLQLSGERHIAGKNLPLSTGRRRPAEITGDTQFSGKPR